MNNENEELATIEMFNPFTGDAIYQKVRKDSNDYKNYVRGLKKERRAKQHLKGIAMDVFKTITEAVHTKHGIKIPDMIVKYVGETDSIINGSTGSEMFIAFAFYDESIENNDYVYNIKVSKSLRKREECIENFRVKDSEILAAESQLEDREIYLEEVKNFDTK